MSIMKHRGTFNDLPVGRAMWKQILFELFNSSSAVMRDSTRTTPHVRSDITVARIYRYFVLASIPVMLVWVWNIGLQMSGISPGTGLVPASGWRAVLLETFAPAGSAIGQAQMILIGLIYFIPPFMAAMFTAMFWEIVFAASRRRRVDDGWFMHCWLFALLLPMGVSIPQVVAGMSFGVVFGKHIFGGAGKYLVSPALLGVLFLLIGYPDTFAGEQANLSTAGTGAQSAWSLLVSGGVEAANAVNVTWWQIFFGEEISVFGSTSALACFLGVTWLIYLDVASWRIVGGALLGMVLITLLVNTAATPDPVWHIPWHWHLALGSFAYAIAFLATDPTTVAITRGGRWMQGGLLGTLAILIRVFNPSHPEGTLFAVLLAALVAPLFDYVVVRIHAHRRAHRIREAR